VPLLSFAAGTGTTPQLPEIPPPNPGGNTGNNSNLPAPGTPNSYKCNIPRGIRNNNPGNLRNGNYTGTVANNTDYDCASKTIVKKYAQFQTVEYGVLAMIKILMQGLTFGLPFTPQQVLNKYPNAMGNGQYITAVSQLMGVSPLQPITWNKNTIRSAVQAIARLENGQSAVSDDKFEYAWTVLYNKTT
jgi:hypothetical protein